MPKRKNNQKLPVPESDWAHPDDLSGSSGVFLPIESPDKEPLAKTVPKNGTSKNGSKVASSNVETIEVVDGEELIVTDDDILCSDDLKDDPRYLVSTDVFPELVDDEPIASPGLSPKLEGLEEEESNRSLVKYDPLEAYLREIRRFSQLSREEEKALAVRYYRDKDKDAAYKIISSNLWLVVKIAREYERAARNLLDLIQEGNIGLLEAIKNFDPYREVRFPSYASWWVKAYIIRYIIANWRLVKIGTTQAQRKLFFNLNKEKERLERQGFVVGAKMLAENLDVRESEVVEMQQRLGSSDMSIDVPFLNSGPDESEANLLGILPNSDSSAEELMSHKEIQQLLTSSMNDFELTLNENEKTIFRMRLLSEDKAKLNELSDSLSISKERVRQIENRIKEKLKEFLLKRHGDDLEDLMEG